MIDEPLEQRATVVEPSAGVLVVRADGVAGVAQRTHRRSAIRPDAWVPSAPTALSTTPLMECGNAALPPLLSSARSWHEVAVVDRSVGDREAGLGAREVRTVGVPARGRSSDHRGDRSQRP